jgi:hypothetical protein
VDRSKLANLLYLTSDSRAEDGRCHICLKKTKLSREHVPPRSAFNEHTGLWDRIVIREGTSSLVRHVQLRGGLWVKTLCEPCNNGRCSTYAAEYVKFVRHLVVTPKLFDSSGGARLVSVPADTLFLAKQIATMILAIEPVTYAAHCEQLRKFVLSETALFNPSFRVLAFLVPDVPQAGTVTRFHARVDSMAAGYRFLGGEISMFPFGFVYVSEIGPGYDLSSLTDVTRWFTEADPHTRQRDVVSLHCRVTGADSIQCGVGAPRLRPQIDYVGRVT